MLASGLREWLSVTSSYGRTMDRITESWPPSGSPQYLIGSELVSNTVYCLTGLPDVQHSGGRRGHCTGTFLNMKSLHTQSCVLAFPARRLNANLETPKRCAPSQATTIGWEDPQQPWPLWTCSGLQSPHQSSRVV